MAVWVRNRSDASNVLREIVARQQALGRHFDPHDRPGWRLQGAVISPEFATTALNVWVDVDGYVGMVVGVDPAPPMELNLDDRRKTKTALVNIDGDLLLLHTGKFSAKSGGGVLRAVWDDKIKVEKKSWFKISSVSDDDFFHNVFSYYLSRRPSVDPTEEAILEEIDKNKTLDHTEKLELGWARIGQGVYRRRLEKIEKCCRVTGVSDTKLLVASHIRPWKKCRTHLERLDGYNGLLLTAHIDHLFDRGYISFEDEGSMLVSPIMKPDQLKLLGITMAKPMNVGSFKAQQRVYLDYHRTRIFKAS